jgi:GNAT superfamily N-acetyltransferase
MEIKTLSDTSALEIFHAFQKAFENYVIPVDIQQGPTLERWSMSNVNYKLSFGAFDQSALTAFILHTTYGNTLFNFATGVIPSYRGQHFIEKISEKISENVKNFEIYRLEVIRENERALNLYKKLGFLIERELISVRGKLIIGETLKKSYHYSIRALSYTDEMRKIRLAIPSMENSELSLLQNPSYHEVHELFQDGELKAYAIFTPSKLSLKEFGGEDFKFLDQLFLHMKINEENLFIFNIDSSSSKLLDYFEDRGINRFVTQYEMAKPL